MRSANWTAGLALAGVLAFGGEAGAVSFNCAEASKPDEFAICKNTELSILDSVMAQVWKINKDMPYLMGQRGELKDSQEDFLSQRAACGSDTYCIEQLYKKRIDTLTNEVVDFGQQAGQDGCN